MNNLKNNLHYYWSKFPYCIRGSVDLHLKKKYWHRSGIIFIHIPKVAGYSVSNVIYGRPLGHFTALEIKRALKSKFNDFYSFSLVRNPVARLISAYKFAKSGGTNLMGIQNPTKYRIPEFDNFNLFVKKWLVYQDKDTIDGVFKPQHTFICHNETILVNQYLKLESLVDNKIILNDNKKTSIIFPQLNKNIFEEKIIFDDDTKDMIYCYYKTDFKIFGYQI